MQKSLIFVLSLLLPLCSSPIFAGTISGKVKFTGKAPQPKPIDMSAEPSCMQDHLAPVMSETVVTGPDNTLANVIVFVSEGANDQDQVPAQAVTFQQKGCQYIPHVVALHTGQELKILNSDQTTHNVHPIARANREWNKSQTPGAAPITAKYENAEFIPVKCNVHPWMRAYIVVLKTNHYDISKQNGSFTLPDLPPGKYQITAWHETYGTQTADITIAGTETKEVNFTFRAKP